MVNFIGEEIHINDIVVYLRNEGCGSSTIRKCKFIGIITGFTNLKVRIIQVSRQDEFTYPSGDYLNYGETLVYPKDIICKLN